MTDTMDREIAREPDEATALVRAILACTHAGEGDAKDRTTIAREALAAARREGIERAAKVARDEAEIQATSEWEDGYRAACTALAKAILALSDTPSGDADPWCYDMGAAPKDGTSILTVGVDSPHVTETRYLPHGLFIPATSNSRSFQKPAGWYWAGWDGAVGPVTPTAWMLLPTPPAPKGGDRHG